MQRGGHSSAEEGGMTDMARGGLLEVGKGPFVTWVMGTRDCLKMILPSHSSVTWFPGPGFYFMLKRKKFFKAF